MQLGTYPHSWIAGGVVALLLLAIFLSSIILSTRKHASRSKPILALDELEPVPEHPVPDDIPHVAITLPMVQRTDCVKPVKLTGVKTKPCKFYSTPTGCQNGDSCRFAHTERPVSTCQAGMLDKKGPHRVVLGERTLLRAAPKQPWCDRRENINKIAQIAQGPTPGSRGFGSRKRTVSVK